MVKSRKYQIAESMKHIKEPKDVELIVDSGPLSEVGKSLIRSVIQYYKKTGRKHKAKPLTFPLNKKRKVNQPPISS